MLVAEDDDDDYFLFSVALSETGHKVLPKRAENGEALLEQLKKEVPDIIFLDILMPRLDGHQCLKEIRQTKKYDSIPVIVYTSLKDVDSVEYCYREGSNLYVVKPDSFADLKMVLERVLSVNWKTTMYYPPRTEFVVTVTRPAGPSEKK